MGSESLHFIVLRLCESLTRKYVIAVENKNALRINAEQWVLLYDELLQAQDTLNRLSRVLVSEKLHGFRDSDLALENLFQLLKKAEAHFEDCFYVCGNKWLEMALRQAGDWKETFSCLLYDLQWCRIILSTFLATPESVGAIMELADCDEEDLTKTKLRALSKAANQDQGTLKVLLKDFIADHVCGEDRCNHGMQTRKQCLASKLLRKLDFQALSAENKKKFIAEEGMSDLSRLPHVLLVNSDSLPRGGIFLGEGRDGTVEGTTWLDEPFAMKISPNCQSLKEEIAILAGLNHPNTMRLVCCAENKEFCIYVMDRMDKSLYDVINKSRNRKPSLTEAVDLMLQIAQGMKYLHSIGLAHHDLKSLNILVKSSDVPSNSKFAPYIARVADFTNTKTRDESTNFSPRELNIGTAAWMAPEIFNLEHGEKVPERFQPMKTDVYSFGIICSEVISWQPPYPDVEFLGGLFKQEVRLGRRPKLPQGCPDRLAILVQRCWDANPRKRPSFCKICTELRYVKSLLMRGIHLPLQKTRLGFHSSCYRGCLNICNRYAGQCLECTYNTY